MKCSFSRAFFIFIFYVSSAFASNTVFEKVIPDDSTMNRRPKSEFMANLQNPELKRAWINVSYDESILMDNESPLPRPVDILVPGLSYSPETKEIIFTKKDGTKVVCADKVEKGFFRNFSYSDTKKCLIDISNTTISEDTGFFIKKTHGLQISLIIRD
ncbi:MAG: hypothetical protein ACXWRE_07090 [Pseudobdellovibrionaceae bacterium]